MTRGDCTQKLAKMLQQRAKPKLLKQGLFVDFKFNGTRQLATLSSVLSAA